MGRICPLLGPKASAFWWVYFIFFFERKAKAESEIIEFRKEIKVFLHDNIWIFSMVMSIWGVIFLGLLGVFFHIQVKFSQINHCIFTELI